MGWRGRGEVERLLGRTRSLEEAPSTSVNKFKGLESASTRETLVKSHQSVVEDTT